VRAELHDRLTAPLYPLAFVIITYAYLGTPRTTRQSRTVSLIGAAGAVGALRGLGFLGMIVGANAPMALLLPYLGLTAAFVLGYMAIARGIIIEPPTFMANAIAAMMERLVQRTTGLLGQAS
jgi:lipopolysaccharide export system permease protein